MSMRSSYRLELEEEDKLDIMILETVEPVIGGSRLIELAHRVGPTFIWEELEQKLHGQAGEGRKKADIIIVSLQSSDFYFFFYRYKSKYKRNKIQIQN